LAKTCAIILGVVLVLLGVAGLLLGDGLLLGLLNVDVVEDLVHVASGLLLLLAGLQRNASVVRGVIGAVSVIYLLVGVYGFVLPYLFGLLPNGHRRRQPRTSGPGHPQPSGLRQLPVAGG
jgi:hypothetical protein